MASKQEPLKCPLGHILEAEPNVQHQCDLCRTSPTFFRCKQCNHDMCLKCARGVEIPLNAELLKRVIPDYVVVDEGSNTYDIQKGDMCVYMCCGGGCPDVFFHYKVSIGDKGVTMSNALVNMGVTDNRPIYLSQMLVIHTKLAEAIVQELVTHKAYLEQAEIQKNALTAGSAPAQEVMTSNPEGNAETAATAPTPQTMGKPVDLATQLEKLVKMHESGVLTEEEFQLAKKAAIANCSEAS